VAWIALGALFAVAAGKPALRIAVITAATVWTADLLAALLKTAFDRERPYEAVPQAEPLLRWDIGTSMPSGHASASAAAAVILAFVRGGWGGGAAALVAVAVGFARVYIGVHYPSDVHAGAAVGAGVGLVAVALVRRFQPTSASPPRSARARPEG
jgi:membrane-associated phospholipid phosphatase